MRITLALGKNHLERMARHHWYLKGKPRIIPTKAAEHVSAQKLEIHDPIEFLTDAPKRTTEFDFASVQQGHLKTDRAHPDYKEDPCFIFNDNNVLLGGLKQTQVLTNSILVNHYLPEDIINRRDSIKIPPEIHEELEKQILLSCVYDAEQKKLPIKKDPLRPAWRFPRSYGIQETKKNDLLCRGILRICDNFLKRKDLTVLDDAKFSLPLTAHGKNIQLELTSEHLVTSCNALLPNSSESAANDQLPDLSPLHCTVSLEPHNFYKILDFYPTQHESKWKFSHTGFIHLNPTAVRNLYDVPVNADQTAGRLLMKSFCIAFCQARALNSTGELKDPVTVQTIQTDGQFFSMMVYQLNSLDVEGEKRNIFWMEPPMALYSMCEYDKARPTIVGYDPAVLKTILALLSSGS